MSHLTRILLAVLSCSLLSSGAPALSDPLAAAPAVASQPSDEELRTLLPELVQAPTGDALFDAYAEAALGRLRRGIAELHAITQEAKARYSNLPEAEGYGDFERYMNQMTMEGKLDPELMARFETAGDMLSNYCILPREELAAWEPRFGSDPRYWQLCYYCEDNRWLTDDSINYVRFNPLVYRPLLSAYQRGIADAETLLLLRGLTSGYGEHYVEVKKAERQREKESYESQKAAAVAKGENPDDVWYNENQMDLTDAQIEEDYQLFMGLVGEHGLTEAALLDKAVQAAPDEAFVLYERGAFRIRHDDFAGGLADIRAGNAASHARLLGAFPVTALADVQESGRVSVNPAFEAGISLSLGSQGLSAISVLPYKQLRAGLEGMTRPASSEDWEAVIHAYARLGSAARADASQGNLFLMFACRLLQYYNKSMSGAGRISKEEAEALSALSTELDAMSKQAREISSSSFDSWLNDYPVAGEEEPAMYFDLDIRGLYEQMRFVWESWVIRDDSERAFFESTVRPKLLELAELRLGPEGQ